MIYGMLIDGLLAVLLVATLVAAVRLARRLDALRHGRAEFEALIARFTQATEQAERGIAGLTATVAEAGAGLQDRIDRAAALRDDLALLAERGNGLADRLEAGVAGARGGAPRPVAAAPTASRAAPAAASKPAASLSPASQELLRALASVR